MKSETTIKTLQEREVFFLYPQTASTTWRALGRVSKWLISAVMWWRHLLVGRNNENSLYKEHPPPTFLDTPHFCIFCFQEARLSCNFFKVVVSKRFPDFMIVFKSFSWILAVFSPILSLVLVPDHFERDAVCLLSQLTLTYKSLRHRSY